MLIDQLPEITTANDSDELPIEQGTTTRKIKILNLLKNVLKLTGGILTGQLTIADNSLVVQDSRITTGTAPLSNIYGRSVYLNDSTGFNIATLQIMSLTNGREGFQLVAGKKVNGVNKHNYLRMNVDANGDPVVEMNGSAAWRSALGLCYAVNDVFSSTGYGAGAYISNGSKSIHIYIILPKSVENITTVTATTFSGLIRGSRGYVNNVNTDSNWLTIATSVNTGIITNNIVRVTINNTSGFTNVDNNTNLFFTGSISLKFT